MVEKASAAGVAAAIRPPDYRKAVQNIRALKAKKEKIGSINGEISDAWAKIESLKVHKKAGKMFAQLDALEPAERADILRSFNGLADASGWEKEYEDLADKADGNVVHMRLGGENDEQGEDEGGDDDETESDPPKAQGVAKSLESARRHLGSDDATSAMAS